MPKLLFVVDQVVAIGGNQLNQTSPMQDTHPKIHDVDSLEWEQEVQMIQQGTMKPSAHVIKVNSIASIKNDAHDTSSTKDSKNGGSGSVFLRDGIMENFIPRRQRQQQVRTTAADSDIVERQNISRENEIMLEGMTPEQVEKMQEELKDALTPETIAWFKRRQQ